MEGNTGVSGAAEDHVIIDLRDGGTGQPIEPKRIPFVDLVAQHEPLKDEILAEWASILSNASFIGGTAVERFEHDLADYVGTKRAVGVANGTDAITLALRALGLERGDEVITAANTFFATAEAISHAGGNPVLADVDPTTATIDPAAVEAAITHRTRFIVPVHLYGQPADMDPIMSIAERHGLKVVEDNAQALGATYKGRPTGSIGHASAVSFYPGKNLGATGDGGAVTTDSDDVAEMVRVLANHGSHTKYEHIAVGYNSRLDAIHAAALTIKLRHLDAWNDGRRQAAAEYADRLSHLGVEIPAEAEERRHVYHLYVIRHDERDRLRTSLSRSHIDSGLHYPLPIHLTEPYRHLGKGLGSFPEAEDWAARGLSLPMFPGLDPLDIERIAAEVSSFQAREHVLTLDSA